MPKSVRPPATAEEVRRYVYFRLDEWLRQRKLSVDPATLFCGQLKQLGGATRMLLILRPMFVFPVAQAQNAQKRRATALDLANVHIIEPMMATLRMEPGIRELLKIKETDIAGMFVMEMKQVIARLAPYEDGKRRGRKRPLKGRKLQEALKKAYQDYSAPNLEEELRWLGVRIKARLVDEAEALARAHEAARKQNSFSEACLAKVTNAYPTLERAVTEALDGFEPSKDWYFGADGSSEEAWEKCHRVFLRKTLEAANRRNDAVSAVLEEAREKLPDRSVGSYAGKLYKNRWGNVGIEWTNDATDHLKVLVGQEGHSLREILLMDKSEYNKKYIHGIRMEKPGKYVFELKRDIQTIDRKIFTFDEPVKLTDWCTDVYWKDKNVCLKYHKLILSAEAPSDAAECLRINSHLVAPKPRNGLLRRMNLGYSCVWEFYTLAQEPLELSCKPGAWYRFEIEKGECRDGRE